MDQALRREYPTFILDDCLGQQTVPWVTSIWVKSDKNACDNHSHFGLFWTF